MPNVNNYSSNTSLFLQSVLDGSLDALRVVSYPTNIKTRFDYDTRTDGQPVYIGYVARGYTESTGTWLISKYTYDDYNRAISIDIGYGTWTDRATLTYS